MVVTPGTPVESGTHGDAVPASVTPSTPEPGAASMLQASPEPPTRAPSGPALQAEPSPARTHASPSGPVDDHIFLIGRPTLRQFTSFVRDLSVYGESADVRALADQWRLGHAAYAVRERDEPGAADRPGTHPLPESLRALCERFLATPLMRSAFDTVPIDVRMVELDRMVVYQKHINLAFAAEVRERLGPHPTEEHVFRACLPCEEPRPPVRWMRARDTTYVFVSPSNDLRFLGQAVLRPEQTVGYQPPGLLSAMLGLGIGYGSNALNAIEAEGRIVLCNGSHRAYALRDLGWTHVPCVIQRVSNREELMAVAASDLRRDPDQFLRHKRPPMLKDYFDRELCRLIPCTRRVRQVRIRFDVEEVDIPAV